MDCTSFKYVSGRIEAEKSLRHLGTVSVSLDTMVFPHSRDLNLENVERLKRLFRIERGCRSDELANRIPAIIDESQLLQHLASSGLYTNDILSDTPEKHPQLDLPSGFHLECLRGRHRVEAARQAGQHPDKRWTVDLYPSDISPELKYALIDEYANERKTDDGEFYHKIREFQGVFGTKNKYFEMRWWARLASSAESNNKKERLQQLYNHPQFAPAFDAFRHIPALYGGLRLSAINKMISMKCHDLLLHCLENMKDFYYHVFEKDENAMQRLSRQDVETIQLSAPGASLEDSRNLYRRIKAGALLKNFNHQEREKIWANICAATKDCLVPSLFGFFENLKYLQGPSDCMKRLVRPGRGETIHSALEDVFSESILSCRGCPIQISDTTFKLAHTKSSDQFDIMYRQLWLFALREYRDMPKQKKRKLAGVREGEDDSMVLFGFASVAEKFGFRTEQTHALRQRDPDRETTRRFLQTIRKPDRYRFENLDDSMAQVLHVVGKAEPLPHSVTEIDANDLAGPPNRCGVPNDLDQRRDKSSMFLHILHGPIAPQDRSLTSFFIQRSFYFCFFGKKIDIDLNDLREFPDNLSPNPVLGPRKQPPRISSTDSTSLQRLQEPMPVSQDLGVLVPSEEHHQKAEKEAQVLESRLLSLRNEGQKKEALLAQMNIREKELQERNRQLEQLQHGLEEQIRTHKLNVDRHMISEADAEKGAQVLESRLLSLRNEGQKKEALLAQMKIREEELQERNRQLEQLQHGLEEQIRTHKLNLDVSEADAESLRRSISELTEMEASLKSRLHELVQSEHNAILSLEKLKKEEKHRAILKDHEEAKERRKVKVAFKRQENGDWILAHEISVDPTEPSEIQRVTAKYLRKGMVLFGADQKVLTAQNCFERISQDGSYTVYLRLKRDLTIVVPDRRRRQQGRLKRRRSNGL